MHIIHYTTFTGCFANVILFVWNQGNQVPQKFLYMRYVDFGGSAATGPHFCPRNADFSDLLYSFFAFGAFFLDFTV